MRLHLLSSPSLLYLLSHLLDVKTHPSIPLTLSAWTSFTWSPVLVPDLHIGSLA